MKSLIDKAFDLITKENVSFEIFTVSIWTDPSSSASSISIDSKENSEKKVQKSNDWNKKYHDQYMTEGDMEQAKLFELTMSRNCNPADFELRDFVEIENKSIPNNWEDKTKGKCWDVLEPCLKEIGEFAFSKIAKLKIHSDFELSVNGRQDWYEFVWKNRN